MPSAQTNERTPPHYGSNNPTGSGREWNQPRGGSGVLVMAGFAEIQAHSIPFPTTQSGIIMSTNPLHANGHEHLLQAVIEALAQGEMLLEAIDDEVYRRNLPVAFNASIGGHYRHCLDHFRSLLTSAAGGELNYDVRERGTCIETDRMAALHATRALRDGFAKLETECLRRSLSVTSRTSYATAGSQTSLSTVGREIMYVVAHAVHHYALIGIMAELMGIPLPAGFGVAPSTIKHQETTRKAAA